MRITRWALVILLGLTVYACGKDDDNDKKKDRSKKSEDQGGDNSVALTDNSLMGTWGLDAGTFKIEKTFAQNGAGEEKVWEDGELNYHTTNKLEQSNKGDTLRFVDEVAKVKIAKGSFAGAQAGLVQKCVYRIDDAVTLSYECEEDFPSALSNEANVLLKQ